MARKPRTEVDPRTETMSAEALECRDLGHAWRRQIMGPKRRAELARLGQVEKIQLCTRCDTVKTTLWDIVERCPVSSPRSVYADGYLMSSEYAGTGRLSRADAFVASLVRSGELN